MRSVAQRVASARVRVGDETVAEMGEGLLALVGVGRGDSLDDARALAEKLVHLRVFDDAAGVMNQSLLDTRGTLGVVSQFTLFGDARKGRRPSYGEAAAPAEAETLIDALIEHARALGVTVVTGRFRADMDVELLNRGPVTLLLDTRRLF
ncbi:MAG TPA: D-aminoacyl-tRNA deacylase [Myxococcota bacterium]|nr:D-aminoacyl-tRNA deacylase [Myxococcota bacterium]